MTFTVTIGEVSIFLASIAFLLLVIYLIPVIIQLRNTAKAIEEISQNGKKTLEDINSLVSKLTGPVEDLGNLIQQASDVALKATHLADTLVNQIKGPIITLASIIAGIASGLKHFKK